MLRKEASFMPGMHSTNLNKLKLPELNSKMSMDPNQISSVDFNNKLNLKQPNL